MLFRLGIVQIAASSGSDFIAQSIMVRVNYLYFYHLPKFSKDLPLLDHMGSRYPRRYSSFILSSRILRSVNLKSSFDTSKPIPLIFRL